MATIQDKVRRHWAFWVSLTDEVWAGLCHIARYTFLYGGALVVIPLVLVFKVLVLIYATKESLHVHFRR